MVDLCLHWEVEMRQEGQDPTGQFRGLGKLSLLLTPMVLTLGEDDEATEEGHGFSDTFYSPGQVLSQELGESRLLEFCTCLPVFLNLFLLFYFIT